MIIYKNLGPEAQSSFSQTWGVSYALDNCTEWQDVRGRGPPCAAPAAHTAARPQVAIEACKVALVLVVLDLLRITKDRPWFEARPAFRQRDWHSPDASCRAPPGARGLHQHSGHALQRRLPELVAADPGAHPLPDAHDRLSSDLADPPSPTAASKPAAESATTKPLRCSAHFLFCSVCYRNAIVASSHAHVLFLSQGHRGTQQPPSQRCPRTPAPAMGPRQLLAVALALACASLCGSSDTAAPSQVRLALGDAPDEMRVSWQTEQPTAASVVQFAPLAGRRRLREAALFPGGNATATGVQWRFEASPTRSVMLHQARPRSIPRRRVSAWGSAGAEACCANR